MGAGAAAGLRKARARCRDGVPGMRWCLLALPSQLAFLAASPGALGRRLPGRARQELPSHSPLVCSPGLIFRRLRRQRQGNCSPRAGRCYGWFLGGRHIFLASDLRLLAAAQAFLGLSSLGLPIPVAARDDARPTSGEEKKKNLLEGFRQPTLTLFPQNQTSPGSHPNTGESSS